jgi:hypothetical protein
MSIRGFYKAIKTRRPYYPEELAQLLPAVSQKRVEAIASDMSNYLGTNLPAAIRARSTLGDYRTSPYVLMTTAGALNLSASRDLAQFLVDIKLYMGLETSFGKSIESVIMGHFPIDALPERRWHQPEEKINESQALSGLSMEEKSQARIDSVWREIDSSCVRGDRRHLLSIKSGVATINDTQVAAMATAIRDRHMHWLESSQARYGVDGVDVVIGLTYGTDFGTNNKENQILAKLLASGFEELDRETQPGVLTAANGQVRVYRRIGIDYWSYVADPGITSAAGHAFIEVLLGLALALKISREKGDVAVALNERLDLLGDAIKGLRFPEGALPGWIENEFSLTELTWLAAAMSAFFDRA